MPLDPRLFRSTLGLFATGVTVVASGTGADVHAMTANAFSSLSLDPPLVLFCPSKKANMVTALEKTRGFSVNILREGQEALSSFFAGMWKAPDPPPFHFADWEGGPRLEGCVAALGCALEHLLEGGDHWIAVGRVLALHQGPAPRHPLLFYAGKYRQLDPDPAPTTAFEQVFYDPWAK
jgi:flavin reductase (DIM6/NTAB) family NADH-FMN oxidoreductase RutF